MRWFHFYNCSVCLSYVCPLVIRLFSTWAIISLVIFTVYQSFLLIAALIFSAGYYSAPIFYDSKRSIGEVLFFNQFYWSDFWSGKWNAWKKLEWFGCWTKVKSGAKIEWFSVHTAVFERARNWCVKKLSLSERIFLFTCGILKQFFSFIVVKRFGYDLFWY